MRITRRLRAVFVLAMMLGCGDDPATPEPLDDIEWVVIPYGDTFDQVVNVAVLAPEGPPKGVIIAFPWGTGIHDFVLSLMDTYWDEAAIEAGYVVFGVEAFGPVFEGLAPDVMPPILAYLDLTFPSASDDVVITGASNGGRKLFYGALAIAPRVTGILAMPGEYAGEPEALTALAGVPTLLMVGENDTEWVAASEATLTALEGAGVPATLSVLAGQGHVLTVSQSNLVAWIEGR